MLIPLAVGQAVAANLCGRLLTSRGTRLPLTLGGALPVSLTGGYDLSKTARKLDVDLGENGENVNKTIEHPARGRRPRRHPDPRPPAPRHSRR
jgi:hypothetical protein